MNYELETEKTSSEQMEKFYYLDSSGCLLIIYAKNKVEASKIILKEKENN